MPDTKQDIRKLDPEELKQALTDLNQPAFRAKQIYEWLWKKGATSFSEMTNLSKELRDTLDKEFIINPLKIHKIQNSNDGTIKVSFRLFDDRYIEGVLIPTENRVTACVSSQVGCSLDCKFCATGYLKRERNLESGEIYDQVKLLNEIAENSYNKKLDNIVYMGMGEPMLNYGNVLKSIALISTEQGMHMSPQRITVSTAGIAKMIKKLADDDTGVNLALSLHSAINEDRSKIMPINDSNPLEDLKEALIYWYSKTRLRPTLEYTVIQGVNDRDEDLNSLIKFANGFPCKINLIEYNPIDMADFRPTQNKRLEFFAQHLEANKIIAVIRRSRGKDIDAACGQLINKLKKN